LPGEIDAIVNQGCTTQQSIANIVTNNVHALTYDIRDKHRGPSTGVENATSGNVTRNASHLLEGPAKHPVGTAKRSER